MTKVDLFKFRIKWGYLVPNFGVLELGPRARLKFGPRVRISFYDHIFIRLSEMQKAADMADISVLFFPRQC